MTDYKIHFQKGKEKKENTNVLLENWNEQQPIHGNLWDQKARRYLPGTHLTAKPNRAQGFSQLWHPLSPQAEEGEMLIFYAGALHRCFTGRWRFPKNKIHSLLKALRTGRHMWKELFVPGRQGTKPLLLELGQSSLPWKPHSSFGFGELKLCSRKVYTLCTLQGLAGPRTLGNASIPFLAWPPHAQIFPEDALKNLVCRKK